MDERFTEKMKDREIAHDVRVLADFVSIWCDAHHADRDRARASTDAAALGVYGRTSPVLCAECADHLTHGEKRRAYCPKDPKPFCSHCDTHCYASAEREWQREMMRYAGPRSWSRGHAIDGIKHMLEARAMRRRAAQAPVTADEETL